MCISLLASGDISQAAAVSGVKGVVADGEVITISGSDFGAAGPDVILFDDFESGQSGANISTGPGSAKFGGWSSRDGSSYYGTTASVSGSQSFTSDYSVHYANWIQADLPANTRNVFISWWLYLPSGNNYPGEGSSSGINWKQMWLQGSSTNDDDLILPGRGGSTWQINGNEPDPGYSNYTNVDFVKGEWKRLWIWMKGSTSSTSNDGEVKFWELTQGGVVQRENDLGVNNLKAAGAGGYWERVRPNGYGRQTSNCFSSFDDIYIAAGPSAQARVEIGNASTYSDSTRMTILTPTAWSNNSITATVNTGVFSAGEAAYLFVFKADGSVSSGFPVTIGSEGDGGGVDTPPSLSFTQPTTGSSYTIETANDQETITIAGTASDDSMISSVTYSTDTGVTGEAVTDDGYANWNFPVTVNQGETIVVTVTATDDAGQGTNKTLTITCVSGPDSGSIAWDATIQTGDSVWKHSSVRYCVRLLIEGDSITSAASKIALSFQGRDSGDYTIRNVSIAQRDTAGREGDVVDESWTQVFFDGAAWNNAVTVSANTEKLSDPLNFNLQPGTDYYVTFKIDAPSVYLVPPAGYRELTFSTEDRTYDIDWGGNGHWVGEDYHAFSRIYVSDPANVPPTPDFQQAP
ncbi:Ig-like domain-containing protein [Desulfosediminicola ganghwensis]|uniref:Ig-like domain-containing protein n=1 Tax=Desulfosediminicola ganghwensis TaxID=2569540 RepID=UPI0015949AC7|nr:Ig-like domain-containing protein [Desulfosediminicola ganghwensis]